jgi:hypothetical protein
MKRIASAQTFSFKGLFANIQADQGKGEKL